MASFRALVLLLAALISGVLGWDIGNENDRQRCQAHSRNPLEGCDAGKTVFVDVGSSSSGFKTVQSGQFSRMQKTSMLMAA